MKGSTSPERRQPGQEEVVVRERPLVEEEEHEVGQDEGLREVKSQAVGSRDQTREEAETAAEEGRS